MHDPLEQFRIKKIFSFEFFGNLVEITNSTLSMIIVTTLSILFFSLALRKRSIVPTRLQMIAELLFNMIDKTIMDTVGKEGLRFMPSIFTIFIFILLCNLIGIIPGLFTVTSHIAVTFTIAAIIFLTITIYGFVRHGFRYLSLFLPSGTPIFMAPLMIIIELFAYLVRPISLSLRLSANMTAGHIVLKVLASFTIMAGILGVGPFSLLTVLTIFELFIAILQAYIFTILACIYLNDAVNLH